MMDRFAQDRWLDNNLLSIKEKLTAIHPHNREVDKILTAIHMHLFEEGLNVVRVKELSGIRTNNISCRFKRFTGLGIHHYIENKRLETAKLLLARTPISVVDISFKLGYSYQESFTRAFKRFTGHSPTRFRERNFTKSNC
jgi:AraC-like DNA-binding protein